MPYPVKCFFEIIKRGTIFADVEGTFHTGF